ncbi:hypothetical protein FMM05_20640 [Flavobacterium zepuense]|uniref:Uncharacterized protein n=1 Tax=Flavobacterium zepuense TaxID=2593302 RepID=A0A552US67_9FLAO|nr:hypothetical protein [Flavobacterium zepuense]TRW21072.1 hypothetical protein FMM05_20640 [Flavobacterium zepuense]
MAILTKLRSATLIEALVATVLIVVVFIVASLVLNNLLFNSFSRNTHAIENRLFELEYSAQHNTIQLPYSEEFKNWHVELIKQEYQGKQWLKIMAVKNDNKNEITRNRLCTLQN